MATSARAVNPMQLITHHGIYPRVPRSAFVAQGACLIGDVELQDDASIWFQSVLRGDINAIRIGARSNVQDACVLHVTHELPVRIGPDVTIGHRAIVHGSTIHDGCLIGMGAIILDGAKVGPYALVAAGAVVKEGFVVPEGMLAAGVPARIIRSLTAEERQHIMESAANYVQYAHSYRA
jgi:carbonic anhydrase/acetyltransferase-like protein (isoleucine patch superfamily)